MAKTIKQAPHLGAMGINSPGYGPRPGTPEHEEAIQWTKEYWAKLWAGHEAHVARQKEAAGE